MERVNWQGEYYQNPLTLPALLKIAGSVSIKAITASAAVTYKPSKNARAK
jgi:hypothetical protein